MYCNIIILLPHNTNQYIILNNLKFIRQTFNLLRSLNIDGRRDTIDKHLIYIKKAIHVINETCHEKTLYLHMRKQKSGQRNFLNLKPLATFCGCTRTQVFSRHG